VAVNDSRRWSPCTSLAAPNAISGQGQHARRRTDERVVGPSLGPLTITTDAPGGGDRRMRCGQVHPGYDLESKPCHNEDRTGGTAGPVWSGCRNMISSSVRTCVRSAGASRSGRCENVDGEYLDCLDANMLVERRIPSPASCSVPVAGTVICGITATAVVVPVMCGRMASHSTCTVLQFVSGHRTRALRR
jgi:hypothetical protein